MSSQPPVFIVTYGCKVNYYESEAVASGLEAAGVPCVMLPDGKISSCGAAAAFVVNSCAVTSMAEKKTRYGLHKITQYHPQTPVVTMGCALGRISPAAAVEQVLTALGQSVGQRPACHAVESMFATSSTVYHRRERAFIKIQDGCQNFCSYCIIPYKRNQSWARPIADTVAEINAQPSHVREIVLCGINLTYYPDFIALCRAVDACGRAWWISSLEPPMVTPALIAALQQCHNFVPNFHICLQSGCDRILSAMNRHYSTADYAQIIANVRAAFPHATIATDLIVGFPGETDADFEQTVAFLQSLNFDHVHAFPFSPRPGTPAAQMPPVPNAVVTQRMKICFTFFSHRDK